MVTETNLKGQCATYSVRRAHRIRGEVLLTQKEVGYLLGVHPDTVARWVREGRVRAVLTPGGIRRIPLSEVLRLLEERGEDTRAIREFYEGVVRRR